MSSNNTALPAGVSVLMTTFNAMPFLRDAVDSILSQTFTDYEFIIVNDGSTDDSQSYLDGLTDPRITVIHQSNQGTAAASNAGLKLCTREYVARMDADDISRPYRLQLQHDFMQAHPEVVLAGSQLRILGDEKAGLRIPMPLDHETIYQALLGMKHGICHGTVICRNATLQEIGGYWDIHGNYDDLDMALRMAEKGRLANLPQELYHYRMRMESLVGKHLIELRRHFHYAVDNARRRRRGLPERSAQAFFAEWEQRPWYHKAWDAMDAYALHQYRFACVDICAARPWRGYLRMTWAALCSPGRTVNRLHRIFNRHNTESSALSASQGEHCVPGVQSHSR